MTSLIMALGLRLRAFGKQHSRVPRRLSTVSFVMIMVFAAIGGALYHTPTRAAAANAIQSENSLAGDPTWDDFASVGQQDAISGYGSSISINHGQSISFFVTTTAASFTITVYRMGWYGGTGARLMSSLGTFPGVHQAIPAPNPVTGMVSCNWQKTTTLSVPSTWTTGAYLAKLTASNGNKSFIFFVVRNDGGTEDIAFQSSVTTSQAYNAWGGVSLYTNNTNGSAYRYAAATKVSFDRPFDPLDSNGSGQFLAYEYPFIRWAESQGYDLTYTTDVDTHTNINPLTNHKAFLSVGHDEYWSKGMRDNVQNAINSGVNVAFFSANTAYWQIRFEPNAVGAPNRVEVGYKESSTFTSPPGPDPQWNVNNAIVTTRWRDDPVNQPENGLLGVMYQDQVNQSDAYVVQNSSNWIYTGTGFTNGSSVPGIVGYEYDKVWNNGFTPPGLTVLSNSPVVGCCEGSGSSHANSSLYTAASGARVFAAGTIQWSWGLDDYSANYANAGIKRTTTNILNNFIAGSGTTLTSTPTSTPTHPTATITAVSPTPTGTTIVPTATNTSLAATATNTPVPATATNTPTQSTVTATPVPPTSTSTPTPTSGSGVLFSDGFEGGTVPGAWTTSKVSTSNVMALDSAVVHTGHASLKAVQVKGSAGDAYVSRTISGQNAIDVRGYFQLTKPVNFGAVNLLSLYAQSNFVGWVTYNVDPDAPTLTVYNGADNQLTTCNQVPTLNAWHSIELRYVLSAAATGSFTLWVDGVQACGRTAITTSADAGQTLDQVRVGVDTADNSGGLTVQVDDVVVSKSYVGR